MPAREPEPEPQPEPEPAPSQQVASSTRLLGTKPQAALTHTPRLSPCIPYQSYHPSPPPRPHQVLFEHLQLLHAALPSLEGAVLPALLALFHDHRTLCAAAPRALIHDLVRMHCADRPAPLGGADRASPPGGAKGAATAGLPSSAVGALDAPPEQARMRGVHTQPAAPSPTARCTHAHPHAHLLV